MPSPLPGCLPRRPFLLVFLVDDPELTVLSEAPADAIGLNYTPPPASCPGLPVPDGAHHLDAGIGGRLHGVVR